MHEVIYHPDAEYEFLESAKYYEIQCIGLGYKYIFAIDNAIQDIISHPQAWQIIERDIRRHQTKHFPYGIYYRILPDHIRILAVAHLHRDPDYWKTRK